ncbi:MAG: FAD-binding oxidoreductase [Breznakibacter sp.]
MEAATIFESYWLIGLVGILFLALSTTFVVTNWKLAASWWQSSRQPALHLTVVNRQDVTDKLFTLTLAHLSFKILPSFYPGQYLTLEIPINDKQTIKRAYSIANWETTPISYQLGIKQEELGKGSTWLHKHLRPGSTIKVHKPRGSFHLPHSVSGTLVFVAAGIGITPFRAMLQALIQRDSADQTYTQVLLFYSCRHPDQLCYHAEFKEMQAKHPFFVYVPVVTGNADIWTGTRGRIGVEAIQKHVPDLRMATYYLCTGAAMMDNLRHNLTDHGVEPSQIITENYGVAAQPGSGRKFSVTYQGHAIEFDNHLTLFQSLEDSSVPVDGHCQSGSCGLCKCNLVEGKVSYLMKHEQRLRPDEILPCCCVPESDLVLQ